MLETVIAFAAITALFELIILVKFIRRESLSKRWVQWLCHIVAFAANLTVHWGTIVGTMTAITAGLVSFATVPAALLVMTWMFHYRQRRQQRAQVPQTIV